MCRPPLQSPLVGEVDCPVDPADRLGTEGVLAPVVVGAPSADLVEAAAMPVGRSPARPPLVGRLLQLGRDRLGRHGLERRGRHITRIGGLLLRPESLRSRDIRFVHG